MGIFFNEWIIRVWTEALERNEPTLAFELSNGRGRFLFMMFFDPEDKSTKDQLLLFLQNTRYMLPLKLYGAHSKGDFRIFLESWQVEKIKKELQLEYTDGAAFDITSFIDALNKKIPESIKLAEKIKILRDNLPAYNSELKNILDFHERTELIGEVRLPDGKAPREKTLRKLYLYSTRSPEYVAEYIANLKSRNCTLSWRIPSFVV
ncbi:hypothetical protein [Iodobacter fluviatilis]|uniref:Uncharacterized protein n=1 Tax=Iodobacter fluviatilis TaxID=537 RepID=A0A7G3G4N4_9NEIS|nr:hypothetical protein [Iodobacter fluviatilis]QBC42099.1 hypothetical protein C1H71_00015 [Iodobacter fluviatilis]